MRRIYAGPQKALEREAMLRRIRELDAVHSGQRPELTSRGAQTKKVPGIGFVSGRGDPNTRGTRSEAFRRRAMGVWLY